MDVEGGEVSGRAKGPRRGEAISADRAMQIVNNVAEEYIDLGRTDFATKAELCEAIFWLRREAGDESQRLRDALSEIFTTSAFALLDPAKK